jgi:hypothetical protein
MIRLCWECCLEPWLALGKCRIVCWEGNLTVAVQLGTDLDNMLGLLAVSEVAVVGMGKNLGLGL